MLIILQELMHRTFVEMEGRAPKRHEIPRPCDHFDLIAGTGTGGLIAIMLGRLRLDLDTCKDLYVRMTRRVFETDKTFAGIPWKSTMFKASKLEEVIRECVREHTISEREGNDTLANATPMTPDTPAFASSASIDPPQRTMSQSSRYSDVGVSPSSQRMSFQSLQFGNPDALLYDTRENRTKTAVTAVLRGTPVTTMLRSYDSRRETAPEVNCRIWQAGRATSAALMAFKPIQIGQSVFLDEGAGKYNPAPMVLDEAVQNEWPGREVGVFVSVGTGKRAAGSKGRESEWWEGFLGGSMGDFAEARRRLISKLEGCEQTHLYMLNEHLAKRGVNVDNYVRLNVEVGVGEFGMNEWAQLAKISTNTRTYLAKSRVESLNQSAAAKMAKIHFSKLRHDHRPVRVPVGRYSWEYNLDKPLPPAENNNAIELPGDDTYYETQGFRPGAQQYEHRPSIADQKYLVVQNDFHVPQHPDQASPRTPPDRSAFPVHSDSGSSPYQYQNYAPQHLDSPSSTRYPESSPRYSHDSYYRTSAPPIPPKTPIESQTPLWPDHQQMDSATSTGSPPPGFGPRTFMNMGDLGKRLPYPDIEGPPPTVNTASKPAMSR